MFFHYIKKTEVNLQISHVRMIYQKFKGWPIDKSDFYIMAKIQLLVQLAGAVKYADCFSAKE